MLSSIFNKLKGKKQDSFEVISNLENQNLSISKVDSGGWIEPFSASELLDTDLRQKYLNLISVAVFFAIYSDYSIIICKCYRK